MAPIPSLNLSLVEWRTLVQSLLFWNICEDPQSMHSFNLFFKSLLNNTFLQPWVTLKTLYDISSVQNTTTAHIYIGNYVQEM